jgi:hypothetical protein
MLEVHDKSPEANMYKAAYEILVQKGLMNRVNPEKLAVVTTERRGIPMDIGW